MLDVLNFLWDRFNEFVTMLDGITIFYSFSLFDFFLGMTALSIVLSVFWRGGKA